MLNNNMLNNNMLNKILYPKPNNNIIIKDDNWLFNNPSYAFQSIIELYYTNDYFDDKVNQLNFAFIIIFITCLLLACFKPTRVLSVFLFCISVVIIIVLYNNYNANKLIEI